MGLKQTAYDDLTGIALADIPEAVKITIGDVTSGDLYFSPDSLAALAALANGEGPAALAAIFAPAPVTSGRARRSGGTRSGGSREGQTDEFGIAPETYRTWASEHGITISARGRVPASVREAYHAANGGKPAPAAPAPAPAAPASTPAESAPAAPASDAGNSAPASDANSDADGTAPAAPARERKSARSRA